MAALWMARCGIKTRLIDRHGEHVRIGQADGIQSRSLEILDSFDVVGRIWKESCHMVEVRSLPSLIVSLLRPEPGAENPDVGMGKRNSLHSFDRMRNLIR